MHSIFKYVLLILCLPWSARSADQPWETYWQQSVSYEMEVRLDTLRHRLTGRSWLQYVNHSADTLHTIYMHLYPNAYNEGTLLDQNWMRQGSRDARRGGATGITVRKVVQDYQELSYEIQDDTILRLLPLQPLAPGDTLAFRMDWVFRIHPHMDRSGWEGPQYDFGQWYPKFVVYDSDGWHLDPFGDWGEFYGEFGTYRVTLDLPKGYVVGATGIPISGDPGWERVQVDTSMDWTEWQAAFTTSRDSFQTQLDTTMRDTVIFLAENVHDFGWVTSPDFVYEHGQVGETDIHAVFPLRNGAAWTQVVTQRGEQAIAWLSEHIGPYLWPQMTITDALLGGGMEYPMLVMDQNEADYLIAHEIAHNWFYGMLANDEFDHAWMDEGLTSFCEEWYIRDTYPADDYDLQRERNTQFEYDHLPRTGPIERYLQDIFEFMESPRNEPMDLKCSYYRTYSAYYTNSYDKAVTMLLALQNYLGEERLLAGLQLYFQRWHLKHVRPEYFIRALEDASGEELDWFFDQWTQRTGWVDYALTDWDFMAVDSGYLVKAGIDKLGEYFAPVPVTIFSATGDTLQRALPDFRYRDYQELEWTVPFRPAGVSIDPEDIFLDVDRRNNGSSALHALRYDWRDWGAHPGDRDLVLWKALTAYRDAAGIIPGIRFRRVYRQHAPSSQLELWFGTRTRKINGEVARHRDQPGLPFLEETTTRIRYWDGVMWASWSTEMAWRPGPATYREQGFRIGMDHIQHRPEGFSGPVGLNYSRLRFRYHHDGIQFLGNRLALRVDYSSSPRGLGNVGRNFNRSDVHLAARRGAFRWQTRISAVNGKAPLEQLPRMTGSDIFTRSQSAWFSSWEGSRGLREFGDQIATPDDGTMRAVVIRGNPPLQALWMTSVDVSRNMSSRWHRPQIGTRGYLDLGQGSRGGSDWVWQGAAGVEIVWQPEWKRNNWLTTLIRPFDLGLVLPVAILEDDQGRFSEPRQNWLLYFQWRDSDGRI